jgi:tetratricopeptide (TPR) repeat protein
MIQRYLFLLFILLGCTDSKETKLQRFLIQGNDMASKQNFSEAKRYFEQAIRLDSCFTDALNNLGTLFYKENYFGEALEHYTRAIGCSPNFTQAYLNRANTYYALKNFDEALRDLDSFDRMYARDTVVTHFTRGLIHTEMMQYDKALAAFRKAQAITPNDAELLVNVGTVYYYQKNLAAARHALDSAIAINPNEPNAYNTYALVESAAGNFDAALTQVEKALALRPDDPYFLNNRGYMHLKKGSLDQARADIDQSIGEDPYNAWAYRNKGIYFYLSGDYQSALRLLQRAETMDKTLPELNLYLAHTFTKLNDAASACKHYRIAMEWQELDVLPKNCK